MSEEETIKCSSCEAPLAEVWVAKSDEPRKTNIIAECPHCGDCSFIKNVQGSFYVGGTDYTVIEQHVSSEEKYESNKIIEQKLVLKTSRIKKYV